MTISRGDVYFVDLDPVQGREQAGRRPVVVVSIDEINDRPLVITVVIGTKGTNVPRDHSMNARIAPEESGLPLETVFMGFHVRSLDPKRFANAPAGHLSKPAMNRVEAAVKKSLGL